MVHSQNKPYQPQRPCSSSTSALVAPAQHTVAAPSQTVPPRKTPAASSRKRKAPAATAGAGQPSLARASDGTSTSSSFARPFSGTGSEIVRAYDVTFTTANAVLDPKLPFAAASTADSTSNKKRRRLAHASSQESALAAREGAFADKNEKPKENEDDEDVDVDDDEDDEGNIKINTARPSRDPLGRRRREAHSAIERRRRERINDKLQLLRSIVPAPPAPPPTAKIPGNGGGLPIQIHKLSVLQSAIDYILQLHSLLREAGIPIPTKIDTSWTSPADSMDDVKPDVPLLSDEEESNSQELETIGTAQAPSIHSSSVLPPTPCSSTLSPREGLLLSLLPPILPRMAGGAVLDPMTRRLRPPSALTRPMPYCHSHYQKMNLPATPQLVPSEDREAVSALAMLASSRSLPAPQSMMSLWPAHTNAGFPSPAWIR
ncbi:hypothetical protein DFJ73DRAFT_826092 [Zopfochytrium polystomum]|nr:hypothetical protein DFJ73DRAFT_826092 [Zopfochytrium polystomum]